MIRWALPLTTRRLVSTPLALEAVELGQEHARVDHHAVADHRHDVVVEDAARHQLQGEGLPVDDDRVAGVVAALVAHDDLHLFGEQVGELALALVAPLGPHDHRCGHAPFPPSKKADYAAVYRPRGTPPPTAPSPVRSSDDAVAVGRDVRPPRWRPSG